MRPPSRAAQLGKGSGPLKSKRPGLNRSVSGAGFKCAGSEMSLLGKSLDNAIDGPSYYPLKN
jgi:hypothetical protein